MARPYRLQSEQCLYHIMSRGDERKKIFTCRGDYSKFMEYVMKAKERYQYCLYAYCLLSNHFHLMLETMLPNISRIMHYIKGSYTTYYNVRHRRYGHLFQGRFKSVIVDRDSYFLELTRYIHLNPVHAGIAEDPASYVWSSYRGYVSKKDVYLDYDRLRQYTDMDAREYRRFVLAGVEGSKDLLTKVYAGFLLGSTSFIKKKLQDIDVKRNSEEVVQKRLLARDEGKSQTIIRAVERTFRTTLEELRKTTSRPMRRKQILIYLLRMYTGLTNQEIGDIVHMKYPAVSKARFTIERLMEKDKQLRQNIRKIVSSFQV